MERHTEEFEKTIAEMLQKEALHDPLFAESLKKEGKTMSECCDYIISQVEKSGRMGFADREVLSIAKHYYDEDDIGEVHHADCRVVVNRTVELSDDERQMAHDRAMQELINEEKRRMQSKKQSKQTQNKPETAQLDLFSL